jgi:hypothetical protein
MMVDEVVIDDSTDDNKAEQGEPNASEAATQATSEAPKDEGKKGSSPLLKDAWKQVESFGQALSAALQGRENVVMVRVNDEALRHLDMLVEAEITKSRSESAAFLINEGIKANQTLFERIRVIIRQIADLREQLRHEVKMEAQQREE